MTRKEEMLQLIEAAQVSQVCVVFGYTSRGRRFMDEIRIVPTESLSDLTRQINHGYDDELLLHGTNTMRITNFKLYGREEYEFQRAALYHDAKSRREPR